MFKYLSFCFLLTALMIMPLSFVSADYVGPPGPPPVCDPSTTPGCNPPINVGASNQVKTGGLSIGPLLVNGNAVVRDKLVLGMYIPSASTPKLYAQDTGPEFLSLAMFKNLNLTGAAGIQFNAGNTGNGLVGLNGPSRSINPGQFFVANTTLGGGILFFAGGGTVTDEKMRLTSAGTLGLGTQAPNSALKLDVAGNIGVRAKNYLEFNSDLTGGAKEVNAGKIRYAWWSTGLDIVGAGTVSGNRMVRIWDNLVATNLCDSTGLCKSVTNIINGGGGGGTGGWTENTTAGTIYTTSLTRRVGIGTSSPSPLAKLDITNGSIKITDGSQAANKILTSNDANGLASWKTVNQVLGIGGIKCPTGQVLNGIDPATYLPICVTSGGGSTGVSQIIAGTNVTISSTGPSGTGAVTINSAGGTLSSGTTAGWGAYNTDLQNNTSSVTYVGTAIRPIIYTGITGSPISCVTGYTLVKTGVDIVFSVYPTLNNPSSKILYFTCVKN